MKNHPVIQKICSSFLLILLACIPAQLIAQVKQPAPAPAVNGDSKMGRETAELLLLMDTDHDGFIMQSEWNRFFTERDLDGDRRLSPEEIEANVEQGEDSLGKDYGRLAAFERLDVNRDDAVSLNEWPGNTESFRYLDADRSGSLSREEFLSSNARWWNQTFENLDFNGDRIIVRSEWLDSDSSFDRLDRDRNGAIEKREFYTPR